MLSGGPVMMVGKHLATPVENMTRKERAISSLDASGSL
jgi:hypothetical protein